MCRAILLPHVIEIQTVSKPCGKQLSQPCAALLPSTASPRNSHIGLHSRARASASISRSEHDARSCLNAVDLHAVGVPCALRFQRQAGAQRVLRELERLAPHPHPSRYLVHFAICRPQPGSATRHDWITCHKGVAHYRRGRGTKRTHIRAFRGIMYLCGCICTGLSLCTPAATWR